MLGNQSRFTVGALVSAGLVLGAVGCTDTPTGTDIGINGGSTGNPTGGLADGAAPGTTGTSTAGSTGTSGMSSTTAGATTAGTTAGATTTGTTAGETTTGTTTGGLTDPDGGSLVDGGTGSPMEDSGTGTVDPDSPLTGASACLADVSEYGADGPFSYEEKTSGQVKFWIPQLSAGCKTPIVHLANGTGANCGNYGGVLERLASHGFVAVCYENANTGAGEQCIEAVETAISEHGDMVDETRLGFTGHSQGGGAAFVCTLNAEKKWGDAKIYAGHAMEPAHGFGDGPSGYAGLYAEIYSPMFMFNGSSDVLVSAAWVRRGYEALPDTTEAYWYEATGAAHIPVPTSWTQDSAVSWFRWKLLGDKAACEYFKNLPNTGEWSLQEKKNETDC